MLEKDIESQFTYKTLPQIHGKPNFKSLKDLKDKLKENASKIQSNLMGGSHGHLGMCLTPAEQALVSPIPYVHPGNPENLTIPAGATARQENGLQADHERAHHLFHEAKFKNQLTNAIDPVYIKELKNTTTNTYTDDIPTILKYLFTNYGDVAPEIPNNKKKEIEEAPFFTVADPLPQIYQQIEDLAELGVAAHVYSCQLVNSPND